MRRGQSSIEYATVVAVVAAALIGMAMYVKRAVSGKLREGADSIGEQYHPTQTTSNHTLMADSETVTKSTLATGQPLGDDKTGDVMEYETRINQDKSSRTGDENVGPIGDDVWK